MQSLICNRRAQPVPWFVAGIRIELYAWLYACSRDLCSPCEHGHRDVSVLCALALKPSLSQSLCGFTVSPQSSAEVLLFFAMQHRSATPSGSASSKTTDDAIPFFVLAGLMGDRPTTALPSHAGQSMPRRFHEPIVRGGHYQGLFQTAGLPPTTAGPSIPSGRGNGRWSTRPQTAPHLSAADRVEQQQQQQQQRQQEQLQQQERQQQQRKAVSASHTRRPPSRPEQRVVPPLQTLDRVLQKELAYGRIGFPTGHYRPPSNQLPATFHANLQRDRGKSKLRDLTMIPKTLRAWESNVEKGVLAAKHGSTSPGGKGSAAWPSATPHHAAAPSSAPGGDAPFPSQMPERLTPYEMRKFLAMSQRYFLSVRKEAFSTGSRPGSATSRTRERQ
jgi:hypothetical protein